MHVFLLLAVKHSDSLGVKVTNAQNYLENANSTTASLT